MSRRLTFPEDTHSIARWAISRAYELVDCGSHIYFIQGITRRSPIKVGYTSQAPEKRLAALRCSSPNRLILRASVPGDREMEHELHRVLDRWWSHGEWFKPNDDLAQIIALAQEHFA